MMHDDFFGSFDEEESILNFSGTVGFGMNFRFQEATGTDRSRLTRLEAKCYDFPYDDADWSFILSTAPPGAAQPNPLYNFKCMTYRVDNEIVGFYVYNNKPSELDFMPLSRLCVHPDHRTRGYGTILLDNAIIRARQFGMDEVRITVPEYWLDPEENRGIINFVDTTGMAPVDHVRDLYYHYGKTYDGITYQSGGRRRVSFVSV